MKKGFYNILLYLFFPSIISIIFYKYLNISNLTYFIITITPYILLTIYFIFKYKNKFINIFKKINIKNILIMLSIWCIGFILMMITNYIINYLVFNNGIASNEAYNRELLLSHKITYSILMCLFIPFLEEISFRLEFKKYFKKRFLFILVIILLFSLIHIISSSSFIELIYIIPYFILGVSFSYIYIKTDCIYMNILAHILHNTICVIVILFF